MVATNENKQSVSNANQVRAAQVRALIMSKLTLEPKTTVDLFQVLEKEMKELKVDYKNFSSLLGASRRNGLIASERNGLTYNHWKGEAEDIDPAVAYDQRRLSSTPAPNISIGMRAGNLHSDKGYRQVKLKGVSYMEHRVIWIMHNGDIPEELIVDHEDRDPTNSVIDNLRTVTYSTNTLNSDTIDESSSRYIGVSWNQKNRRWQTSIWHKGVSIKLGYFDTEEDAAKVYNIKARELGKENINIIEEVRPNPEGYDIKGHEGKVDLDQVMNMQRVREREAEDKRQENLGAVGSAAEQRMAREELDAKWRERENEIAAEMKKGLRDGE